MLDLLVRGGTVVNGQGQAALDVGVADGRVVGLYDPAWAPHAEEELDAAGLLVLPGLIDAHVHCRAPASPERETFATATRAAAAGGVTTICEMPQSVPPTNSAAVLAQRRAAAERECYVDFAFWGAAGASADDLAALAQEGVCGFKGFLHAAPPGREANYAGLCFADDRHLCQSFAVVAATGLPLSVHAEDEALVRYFTERLVADGRADPAAHGESRPNFVEHIAVAKLLELTLALGARLYLPHISTGGALDLVRAARARGADVTVETCPQYLFFDESVMRRVGPYGRINPPIRPPSEVDALWFGIADGTVDVVASDHSPYLASEKEPFWDDIWGAYCGHPGLETLGPSLLSEACAEGRLGVERAVALLSETPARALGFFPRKGAIQPGADADLVLFDPEGEWRVERADLFTLGRDGAYLFDDARLSGAIVRTIVRGQTVYLNGEIVGEPGFGRFVAPAACGG